MSTPQDTTPASEPGVLHGMNTTASPNRVPSSTSTANSTKPYDEERMAWASGSGWATRRKKYMRFPRLKRLAMCLLLMDLIIFGLVIRAFEPLTTLLLRNEELFGARLTLPLNGSATVAEYQPGRNAIPRILHQTAATDLIPEKWVESQQSCKNVYSDFEYKLWTDEVARKFLSSEYPWFLETWDNYPFPIQRADAIRYFILYHFGGIYLDMDTLCNETIPLHQIENDAATHHAVFKSTKPTGVSNDLMISSLHHPLFMSAVSKLLTFNDITRLWARLTPYCAIMISAGPMFITLAIKNYLLEQPLLPSHTVQVINATELAPYITDLESCSWHKGDAQALMWLGDRPMIWFGLGAIGLAAGLHIINRLVLLGLKGLDNLPTITDDTKVAKLM